MITSYVTPQRSMLYLSLVGPLNDYSAHDLVNEYYERHTRELRQCILDLSGADYADEDGLNVLHRVSLMAEVDGVEFAVVARGSAAEREIEEAAQRYTVPLVDGRNLPFPKRVAG